MSGLVPLGWVPTGQGTTCVALLLVGAGLLAGVFPYIEGGALPNSSPSSNSLISITLPLSGRVSPHG